MVTGSRRPKQHPIGSVSSSIARLPPTHLARPPNTPTPSPAHAHTPSLTPCHGSGMDACDPGTLVLGCLIWAAWGLLRGYHWTVVLRTFKVPGSTAMELSNAMPMHCSLLQPTSVAAAPCTLGQGHLLALEPPWIIRDTTRTSLSLSRRYLQRPVADPPRFTLAFCAAVGLCSRLVLYTVSCWKSAPCPPALLTHSNASYYGRGGEAGWSFRSSVINGL